MKLPAASWRSVFLFLIVLGALGLSGCASTEPENLSTRPWNTPTGWESGLPVGLMEGR